MEDLQKALDKAIFRIAIRIQNELMLAAPVDTGRLRNSIKVKPSSDGSGIIINLVDYAKFVEFGTPPHVIEPKDKQALKFKGDNKFVIVKKVKHPGTRPNPFIRTTLTTKLKNIITEEIIKAQQE